MTIFLKKPLKYVRSEEFRQDVYLFIAYTFVNYNVLYAHIQGKKIMTFVCI